MVGAAKLNGLLLYPSTGCADGTDGDLVMLGPPFVLTGDELGDAVHGTIAAIRAVLPG